MEQDIAALVTAHPEWTYQDASLVGEWKFASFTQLRAIVVELCQLADRLGHHPTVTYGYNTLQVVTTTHDAGDTVTSLDLELARRVSQLVG